MKIVRLLSSVTYSPTHRKAGTPMINIQSTLHTATDLYNNVSLANIDSNGNTYTNCTYLDTRMCIYAHIPHSRDASRAKEMRLGQQ